MKRKGGTSGPYREDCLSHGDLELGFVSRTNGALWLSLKEKKGGKEEREGKHFYRTDS